MKHLCLALTLCALPALAEAPPEAQIVLLGEVHDNADAHQRQADIIANLSPTAVLFEMLTPEQGRAADADRSILPTLWAELPWPDYALYQPVFDALGDARIVGMAVPRETNRAVFTDGPVAAFGPDAARYGLDQPLDSDQQARREALQYDAHCQAMPREMMGGMVDVQRFWDASFARAALEALDEHGRPVAVILGNGHARTDWGVPAVLARVAPQIRTHAVGLVEGEVDMPFDTVELVRVASRPDPCAALVDG